MVRPPLVAPSARAGCRDDVARHHPGPRPRASRTLIRARTRAVAPAWSPTGRATARRLAPVGTTLRRRAAPGGPLNADGSARSASRTAAVVHGSARVRATAGARRVSTRAPVRVGMICPYSLTLPGGVQGQVLGLARSLRAKGIEVRVLGPVRRAAARQRGHAARASSVPLAANGSVAPIAPDPAAQLRMIRAIRDEGFDLLHLHEPLVPGPDGHRRVPQDGAADRHVPRGGRERRLPVGPAARAVGRGPARRCGAWCPRTPGSWRWRRSAASTSWCSTASSSTPTPRPSPSPTDGPDHPLLRSPRAPQGPGRAARGHGAPARRHPAVDRQRRSRDRRPCATATPATPASSGWGASATTRRPAGCGAPTCSARRRCGASRSVSCCSRPWPPARRWWRATCPGYANVARAGQDALLVPPGDADGAGRGAPPGARRRATWPPSWSLSGEARAGVVLDGPPGRPLPRALRAHPPGPRGRPEPIGAAPYPVAECGAVHCPHLVRRPLGRPDPEGAA